ncbi:MAG: fatty acid desaturase [Melioribacteraceae bacterium]|nr:fatty acid desaturase [Melioribacteraceae bacterium]
MGILISSIIFLLWFSHLYYSLVYVEVNLKSVITYIHILIQTYFYTGLFITAHDAMHKTVSKNLFINNLIGTITSYLYAGMSYKKLKVNHFKHHKYPGSENDPDFNIKTQNFFIWWLTFLIRYSSIVQLIIMGLAFNVLKIWVEEIKLWFYWVIPAFLSSLQLFYFGTYLPHKKPHTDEMEPHKARSQIKNHLWAMITCYFFGYHYEHHDKPFVPWWKLYQLKN